MAFNCGVGNISLSTIKFGHLDQIPRHSALVVSAATATVFCIAVPRIGPLVIAAIALLAAIYLFGRDVRANGWEYALRATLVRPEIPFAAWVFIACLWSEVPTQAFFKALYLSALILGAIVIARHASDFEQTDIHAVAQGFLIGFVLTGLYLAAEIVLRDAVGRMALTYFPELDRGLAKHGVVRDGVVTKVSGAHITRVAAVFCLLWCPAALALSLYTKGILRWVSGVAILVVSLAVLLHPHSHSQTAQLALLVVIVFTGVAALSPWLAKWAATAVFAGFLFLIVPVSLGMYAAKLHENPDLFKSGRARVIIWNYTAERILEHPLLGVGTNSTRTLDEKRSAEAKEIQTAKKLVVAAQTRAHPHNIYLQVWYELGIVGVLTFALFGLSLVQRVDGLQKTCAMFAIGHYAMCATVIASTYGLWQNWFQAAIMLSAILLVLLANRVAIGKQRMPSDQGVPVA